MPYDKNGMPRSGHARTNFANSMSGGKPGGSPGGQSKEKPATGMGGGEKPAGEMHAHSHKGGEHDISDMSIQDAVEAHGPATHMFTQHDHESGDHHVHTVHGQKHHHSDHETALEAHEHMGHALGGESDDMVHEDEPDGDEAESPDSGSAPSKPAWMA